MTHGFLFVVLVFLAGCYGSVEPDMPLIEKYGVLGLVTDPSPMQVKQGALSSAHNVCFRRPNMGEPRPGFEESELTDLDEVWGLIPYDSDLMLVGADEFGSRAMWLSDVTSADLKDEDAAALDWTYPYVRGTVARKNLYLTTSDAVRKVTAGADLVASLTRLDIPLITATNTGTGTILATNTQTAYRVTLERRDANGVVTVSTPSGRALVSNTGAACAPLVFVYLRDTHAVGDMIRVWRSTVVSTSTTPSDDLRLVWQYELTSASLAGSFPTLSFTDNVADADRGESLYTNPTREGIERVNIEPPLSRDLALYQGSLFAANVTYPPGLTITWTEGLSTGPTSRATNSTRTNLSNQIVVASATGLEVGQALLGSRTNWSGTGMVRITAIAGTTLTMNATWNGATDGAPVSLSYGDTIRIKTSTEDQYYYAYGAFAMALSINTNNYQSTGGVLKSEEVQAIAVNDIVKDVGTSVGARRQVRLQTLLPSHAGFQVYATHGSSYEPALPAPTVTDGEPSVANAIQNGLAWSKTDQPEHFLLSAIRYVGKETGPILRIIPTRDSLLIFKGKGDGIYRLTGFGELSGWRVDPIEVDTYLLHPNLAVETDGRVFAWTNKGMVEVTDAGVSPAMSLAIADLTAEQERTLAPLETLFYAFGAANTKDNELIFGMPAADPTAEEGVSSAYVYNTRTQSWSTWLDGSTRYSAMAYGENGLLYLAKNNSGQIYVERDPSAAVVNADATVAINITAVDSTTGRLTYTGTYTAQVGDLIEDHGGRQSIVVTTDDATHCYVQSAASWVTGTGSAYVAFMSSMTWQPDTQGSGTLWKRYREQVTHWDDFYGVARWSIQLSRGDTPALLSYTYTLDRSQHFRRDTRALPPRETARARHLAASVIIQCADAQWRISGIAFIPEESSVRAHR